MTERFSSIRALADWLFRSRRTPNVSPAAELEPPKAEPGELDEAHAPVSVGTGRQKRRSRMLLYNSEHGGGGNDDNPERWKKRVKKGPSPDGPTPISPGQQINIELERRRIVVEKVASSLSLDGLDDERLLAEVRRSKSEISEEGMLGIIGRLQTDPVMDLMNRHKKTVQGGPFEGYHEVRRGKAGRVLFFVDEENVLHIRIGNHGTIYATRKSTKDPARSL